MTEPMKQGALARVHTETRNLTLSADGKYATLPVGFEFEVEDYVSDAESDDGQAFYWGNSGGGANNVAVSALRVEQAKSAEEMRARRIPTRQELLEALTTDLLVSNDELRIDEVDKPQHGATEVYGRAANGLAFGARIRIEQIWRTDD